MKPEWETARRQILDAVLENMDDDFPRLVFADHLREFGPRDCDRTRGEYIAASVNAYRVHGKPFRCRDGAGCEKCCRHFDAADKLLVAEKEWTQHPGCSLPPWWQSVLLRSRGFVAWVACPLDGWKTWGPDLMREHPVESLTITGARVPSDMQWVVRSRYASSLRTIRVMSDLPLDGDLEHYLRGALPTTSFFFRRAVRLHVCGSGFQVQSR